MSALVHDTSEGGDSRRVMATMADDDGGTTRRSSSRATETELPARFKGKTSEQLVEMYTNLESHSGRLANSLGQTQKQLTEALAIAKRQSDIGSNSRPGEVAGNGEINSIDLLTNPTKALESILSQKIGEATTGLRTQITSLEGQLHQSRFERNHSDAQTIFQDQSWQSFVGATPLRTALAQRAQQGDYQAADTLLTEFKASRTVAARNDTSQRGQEDARRVTLESGNSGGSDDGGGRPTGKIYKRADIMQMMQRDPDLYYSDAVQDKLMAARREGRIVD